LILGWKNDRQISVSGPIHGSCAAFDQSDPVEIVSFRQFRPAAMNLLGAVRSTELVSSNLFLRGKLLVNELARNTQRRA